MLRGRHIAARKNVVAARKNVKNNYLRRRLDGKAIITPGLMIYRELTRAAAYI